MLAFDEGGVSEELEIVEEGAFLDAGNRLLIFEGGSGRPFEGDQGEELGNSGVVWG